MGRSVESTSETEFDDKTTAFANKVEELYNSMDTKGFGFLSIMVGADEDGERNHMHVTGNISKSLTPKILMNAAKQCESDNGDDGIDRLIELLTNIKERRL